MASKMIDIMTKIRFGTLKRTNNYEIDNVKLNELCQLENVINF